MELIIVIIIFYIIKKRKQNASETVSIRNEKKGSLRAEAAKENISKAAVRAKQRSRSIGKEALGKARQGKGLSSQPLTYEMPKRTSRTTPVQEQLNRNRTAFSQEKNKELTDDRQIRKRQMEHKNMSILERAKENAAEEAMDETLHSMQARHGHLESMSSANHMHPEDMLPGNVLGTVSDLMAKGYEGNLYFERDFVGEAMDMIGRFQPPTEVPTYSTYFY
uniref:hypothetical protein n=1 Tax=Agathobacter sp. TaxID=2021311 RepID=UPI00405672E0